MFQVAHGELTGVEMCSGCLNTDQKRTGLAGGAGAEDPGPVREARPLRARRGDRGAARRGGGYPQGHDPGQGSPRAGCRSGGCPRGTNAPNCNNLNARVLLTLLEY